MNLLNAINMQAIIQERKRYGFVLERQTSLSKHFLAHYGKGAALIEKYLDGWQETSRAREDVPACVEFLLGNPNVCHLLNIYFSIISHICFLFTALFIP